MIGMSTYSTIADSPCMARELIFSLTGTLNHPHED
jgi:hypothetical protein